MSHEWGEVVCNLLVGLRLGYVALEKGLLGVVRAKGSATSICYVICDYRLPGHKRCNFNIGTFGENCFTNNIIRAFGKGDPEISIATAQKKISYLCKEQKQFEGWNLPFSKSSFRPQSAEHIVVRKSQWHHSGKL